MKSPRQLSAVLFAATTVLGRAQGASDVRPYVLLSKSVFPTIEAKSLAIRQITVFNDSEFNGEAREFK
jgi:hypothetical protein